MVEHELARCDERIMNHQNEDNRAALNTDSDSMHSSTQAGLAPPGT